MHYNFVPNSIFHKKTYANFSGEWLSDYEHDQYLKNQASIDEYYHATSVNYCYNSLGYRSKEFDQLDGDFLLAMGCSHTEGIALPEKDIWCSVLADMMDLDLINLGAGGQGLEFICYNTDLYLRNNLPLPKLVVIQHPERARIIYAEKHTHNINESDIVELTVRVDDRSTRDTEAQDIHNNVYTTVIRSAIYTNMITRMWNSVGVPVYHWTFNTDGEDWLSDYQVLEIPHDIDRVEYNYELDHARDLTHHGYRNHSCVAAILKDKIAHMLDHSKLNTPVDHGKPILYADQSLEHNIEQATGKLLSQERIMSDQDQEHTHEGSLGTDRDPPSGTEEQEREAELKRRIEELRKRDPFIYR